MHEHEPIKGASWMVLAAICFAIINNIVQYLNINYHLSSTTVAMLQYGLALLFIFPWLLKLGIYKSLQTRNIKLHILRVILGVIGLQLWFWALAYPVPIWQGIALLMLSPIFTTLGSRLILKEDVGLARWLATLSGFMGAALILEPWAEHFYLAACLPVGAAFFWSCSSITVKKLVRSEDTQTLIVYLLLFTTPFNVLIALGNWSMPAAADIWYLIILGGSLTAIAQYALVKAYTIADASFVQPFDNIKLPLNVAISFLVFGTVPPGRLWLGAIFIVSAAVFITHYETSKRRKQRATIAAPCE
jgi:drug/metabolite transporter (DMT)-like permease